MTADLMAAGPYEDGTASVDRQPPHDIGAEQAVLGAMMLSSDAVADAVVVLKPGDFYRPAHELVFRAALELFTRGAPVDAVTVADALSARGELPRAGGAPYLHTLVSQVPTAANAAYYTRIIRGHAQLRLLAVAAARVSQMAYTAEGDVEDIVAAAQAEMADATEEADAQGMALFGAGLDAAFEELEAIERGETARGVPTGLLDFDALTQGLHPGQLVIVAGRPAMGKTTLAMDWARHAAVTNALPTAFFSLEMGAAELRMRVLSAEARVGLQSMRAGRLGDAEWQRLAAVQPRLRTAPLWIDDSPTLNLATIRARARKLAQRQDLRLVVVDYLQLMESGAARRPESRQAEVAEISRGLKLLAKELDVPVVALSQLNRGSEQRMDKTPQMSDLRESGSLEQDADVVVLVHRPDVYEADCPRAGEADLIIAKHRNGPTSTLSVAFQGHYSRFVDMART